MVDLDLERGTLLVWALTKSGDPVLLEQRDGTQEIQSYQPFGTKWLSSPASVNEEVSLLMETAEREVRWSAELSERHRYRIVDVDLRGVWLGP
ncbi:hypothetical protein LZ198_37840 [Myxococcus sp. K15C18031901]|uniref:hypothetical protein n=1 Tax=Myxococcus dinghuensis TaxID=2906761 RepID=UPI0020A800FC|nr:hypothetical protein [Myxococcus dinghuensis]MCP3104642.1 hypothetical protein [Myxococcus dinghuensis]